MRRKESMFNSRGITLLEVLVAIFILTFGVLGIASLIPIGKLALVEVEKSDRTGACGRAAIRDIQIRKMLGFNNWSVGPAPGQRILPQSVLADAFVVDPLGYSLGLTGNMGPLPRLTLLMQPIPLPPAPGTQYPLAKAEKIFRWHDDLAFVKLDDGGRPQPVIASGEHQYTGNFSWFFTATPGTSDMPASLKRYYNVSVAVCYKRDFAAGETVVDVTEFSGGGHGGGTIAIATPIPNLKRNMWVMLTGWHTVAVNGMPQLAIACRWYRVVSVANELTPPMLSLVGPDWDLAAPTPSTPVKLIFVDSVTGVYRSPMQVEHGLLWD